MKETMDLIYMLLILIISTSSILLNVWLANAYHYYKSSERRTEIQVLYWKETAQLYQSQMHEAEDRHWKTLDELSLRV